MQVIYVVLVVLVIVVTGLLSHNWGRTPYPTAALHWYQRSGDLWLLLFFTAFNSGFLASDSWEELLVVGGCLLHAALMRVATSPDLALRIKLGHAVFLASGLVVASAAHETRTIVSLALLLAHTLLHNLWLINKSED